MTEKRFTNIEHDYENAWIKCNDNGDFMIYAIYKELDESLPSLEDLLNGLSEENEQLKQFKEQVFLLIDKKIRTLEANSKQCHLGGCYEKGIEFTLQAELLKRLKKELSE